MLKHAKHEFYGRHIYAVDYIKPGQRYSLWNKRWCYDQLWQNRGIVLLFFLLQFYIFFYKDDHLPVSELFDWLSCVQVVNRLRKEFVHETLLNYGVHYDKTWIYDKIHHEINQFCSAHSLQQVYIDMFDQVSWSFWLDKFGCVWTSACNIVDLKPTFVTHLICSAKITDWWNNERSYSKRLYTLCSWNWNHRCSCYEAKYTW